MLNHDLYKNKKKEKNINGLLLLDKPTGYSSNYILQKIKKSLQAKKAGYSGTLDPLASGMLPILFGTTTKLSEYLLNTKKQYFVTAKLGERTDTSDSYGNIISTRPIKISESNIYQVLSEFKGEIYQTPPMFSALKYKGVPLYKYARKKIYLPRKKRKIYIDNIELISFSKTFFSLKITCSKGTYIRQIIDDIGEKLLCGAHVIALRRTKISNYKEKNMIHIDMLYSHQKINQNYFYNYLIPTEKIESEISMIIIENKKFLQLSQIKK
ncbi:MAG: tRNA U55 pseudouridine synthase [Wigglesworthia glossinidia]|nr:tRNA U55 pseudouridine synthase [Wigglesworthia glossinidia]